MGSLHVPGVLPLGPEELGQPLVAEVAATPGQRLAVLLLSQMSVDPSEAGPGPFSALGLDPFPCRQSIILLAGSHGVLDLP